MKIPSYSESEENDLEFPDKESEKRLSSYERFDMLQDGQHFDAFNITLENDLNRKWGHLKYLSANFAGLISKIIADMLFGDPVKFKLNSDANQAFIDAIVFNNKLHIQNYESAISNSARGDAVYKIRIGKRYETDEKPSIIVEDISPYIYFPDVDEMNMRGAPKEETLAWFIDGANGKKFVRKEIHSAGIIENQLWEYNKDKKELGARLPWNQYYPDEPETVETKIKKNLIVHVPNWRKGTEYFGTSDYVDLESLFFALNNRLTKIDSVLDKHTDPILAVPEGILDEDGQVQKKYMDVFEIPAEGGEKPAYITWDANLQSAFTEIDQIVKFLYMFSETSPDALGMGEGKSDSGRALKLRLLRTIAKKKRKERYYDQGLKEVMTIVQELSIAWNIDSEMDGKRVAHPSVVETPEIEFGDGYVQDTFERAQEEQIRLTSGTTTKEDAIMRLDGVDAKTAEEKVKEIQDAEGLALPLTDGTPPTNTDQATQPPVNTGA